MSKSKKIRMASVDEMLSEGFPVEDMGYEAPRTVTIAAARNFDQMRREDILVVDPEETYWSNQLLNGNVVIVEDQ